MATTLSPAVKISTPVRNRSRRSSEPAISNATLKPTTFTVQPSISSCVRNTSTVHPANHCTAPQTTTPANTTPVASNRIFQTRDAPKTSIATWNTLSAHRPGTHMVEMPATKIAKSIIALAEYPMKMRHRETHRTDSVGWLRAAVLGANDGLISTSSLIVGIASARPERAAILLAGAAGLVAGALAMAAGEYVSVSSQSDSEDADLAKERKELETTPEAELTELTAIYVSRGLTKELAHEVAVQFTAHDALAAHARDELGIFDFTRARPVQAALTSAAAFASGAALPLLLAGVAPVANITPIIGASSLLLLFVLGALGAKLGGAPPRAGALRVAFWGTVAMAATALVGRLFGTAV